MKESFGCSLALTSCNIISLFHWTRLARKHNVMRLWCQFELDDFSGVWFDPVEPPLVSSSLARSLIHFPINLSHLNPPPAGCTNPRDVKKEWGLCLSLLKRCLNLKSSQLSYSLERLIFSHVFNRSRAFDANTNIRERPRLNLKSRRQNPPQRARALPPQFLFQGCKTNLRRSCLHTEHKTNDFTHVGILQTIADWCFYCLSVVFLDLKAQDLEINSSHLDNQWEEKLF